MGSRTRFQCRLRTLFFGMTLITIAFNVVRIESAGRIRSNPSDFCDNSSSIFFVCRTPADARNVCDTFDTNQFIALAAQHFRSMHPNAKEMSVKEITAGAVTQGLHKNVYFIKYDFPRWGRYRLSLRQFRYVHAINDPVAKYRNEAIHKSFLAGGESITDAHSLIQSCESSYFLFRD